ncbi:Alpha-methylacyl-CoA racemase [Pseudonocardia dioxanivorans CB1190]|uniref:Alpha-methylacyl-CoA racemase n=1 Tax=Pseudonocardia dioxanivorans (strain ATCC 55486 / DSM 44775 / JCM 13855 / CB1190) TaxID=675635 RepID=F4CUL1_PSEUX|nr:Alpha-methylacyl-CoA racemase [Pseudonocardia dioxanivorans CB1190]
MVAGPLAGVRVLDFSWIGVGCITTWLLAELGAEVWKVEPVDGSDNARTMEPLVRGVGVNHLVFDRGKKSFPVDVRRPEGREAYLAVASVVDVVVEGMRPGVADRLGVGAEALRERNPALSYVTLPGYGSGGPLSATAGHDLNYAAMAGVLSMARQDRPAPAPVQVADWVAASLAALAAVSGVHQAGRTRTGLVAESSLFDGAMFALVVAQAQALMLGLDVGPRTSMLNGELACYAVYTCADGELLAVAALEERFWRRFCALTGIDDEGAQYDRSRQDRLRGVVAGVLATRPRAEWLALFADQDVCVSPVLTVAQGLQLPHVRERAGVVPMRHPDGSVVDAPAAPLRVGPPGAARPTATAVARTPALGEGARELLGLSGRSSAEIDRLHGAGVVFAP